MTPPPLKTPTLMENVLATSQLIVAVGSGGVGKTTTSAAIAIAGARQGKRCAVLTIDPARRLAQALGIERMGNQPQPLAADICAPGSVDAMMLETAECFDDLISRLVPDPERKARLLQNRLYQVIARHLGGTHEYMAVEKLYALTASGDYDLVILDTPPSVNALDFLDAPSRIANFFSEKIQRYFTRQEDAPRSFFQKLKDRVGEAAVSVLGLALGETFMNDVRDFAVAFQTLFAAFRERGEVIEKLLADKKTSFLVVSGADPVRVAETLEFATTLERFDITPRIFIANRVHIGDTDTATPSAAEVAAMLTEPHDVSPERVADVLREASSIRAALRRRDAEGLERMVSAIGKGRMVVIPELEDEVKDRAAVEHVLAALGCEARLSDPT